MAEVRYGQYCPVAMSAEILCTRWTIPLVRELLQGSRRFNDLRRGIPRISPALLASRLRELEAVGIVERAQVKNGSDLYEYALTEAGKALGEVVGAFAKWGQTWLDEQTSLDNASIDHLMWELRRHADASRTPRTPAVINFHVANPHPGAKMDWWLILEAGAPADVCWEDPGREVDLYVASDLRTLTAIWLGLTTVAEAVARGALELSGDKALGVSMQRWLGLSPVAGIPKRGGVRADGYAR
jgi:DNA-binding HxlR family transcriptional regulator